MPIKKRIAPGEKVPLKLTASQRQLVLDDLLMLDPMHERTIRETPADQPVMMSLDDLEDFAGYIAAEANHSEDRTKEDKLDRIFDRCQRMLDGFTDEPADEQGR